MVRALRKRASFPQRVLPIEEWLRPQKRFAHLFAPGAESLLDEIQAPVDRDWLELLKRCRPRAAAAQ
jgi:pyruvate ferredoxin oxidoreductase beta subunit